MFEEQLLRHLPFTLPKAYKKPVFFVITTSTTLLENHKYTLLSFPYRVIDQPVLVIVTWKRGSSFS